MGKQVQFHPYPPQPVPDCPTDYISDLKLTELPDLNLSLLVTAWDGSISIFQIVQSSNDSPKAKLVHRAHHEYPLLCCCIVNDRIFVGSVQGEVLEYSIKMGRLIPVVMKESGDHSIASLGIARLLPYLAASESDSRTRLVCGSWDGSLYVIDADNGVIETVVALGEAGTKTKILTMDADSRKLVVATTGGKLRVFDLPLRNEDRGIEVVSALKYQIRDVKVLYDGAGYVISSIDGRVAVEFFEDSTKQFAFRCHRVKLTDTELVFPVNTLAFIPKTYKLLTGGSDSCVSLWSLESRRRLRQFNKLDSNGVVRIACNSMFMAVATSDDSFKTNAAIVVNDSIELQPSNLYLIPLC